MELTLVRAVFTASLSCSIVLGVTLIVIRRSPDLAWPAGSLLLATGLVSLVPAAWYAIAYLHRRQRPILWLLSVGVVNLLIVVPELGLRVLDFRAESRIEFGYPRPVDFLGLQPHDKLFW